MEPLHNDDSTGFFATAGSGSLDANGGASFFGSHSFFGIPPSAADFVAPDTDAAPLGSIQESVSVTGSVHADLAERMASARGSMEAGGMALLMQQEQQQQHEHQEQHYECGGGSDMISMALGGDEQQQPAARAPDATSTLQQQAEALRSQQQGYQTWLLDYLTQADPGPEHAGGPAHVPSLLAAMYSAWVGRNYLHYHREAAEAGRELERRLREVEALRPHQPGERGTAAAAAVPPPLAQYVSALQECTAALAAALYAQDAAAFYAASAWAALPALQAAGGALDARLQQGRYGLYQQMEQDVQDALDAAAWPPPLVPVTLAPSQQQHQQQHQQHTGSVFAGFSGKGEDPTLLPRLNALLACMNRLQATTERQQFAALQQQQQQQAAGAAAEHGATAAADAPAVHEGPLLWSVGQLASQLQARLQSHFSPGTEAGRLDHPEWLLKTVISFLQDNLKYVEQLQPSILDSELHLHYNACVEFVRAVREAVRAVLRGCRLPALLQGEGHQYDLLWILQVDAILDFERQLAPFLGAMSEGPDDEVPDSLAAGSCLSAVTQEPDFLAAWAAAERRQAEARIAPLDAVGVASRGGAPEAAHGGENGGSAWRREFAAPAFAETAADVVALLVDRSRHVPGPQEQLAFLELSAGPLLEDVEQRLRAGLAASGSDGWEADEGGAAAGPGVTSPERAPMVCACINSAHYLHHQLSELLLGPALFRIAQQHDPSVAAAQSAPASFGSPLRGSQPAEGAAAAAFASPARAAGFGDGDVVMRPSFVPEEVRTTAGGGGGGGALASHAASLAALHREGCLAVARELARGFGRLAVKYREEVVRASVYPTHVGPPDAPSPQLVPALAWLEQRLGLLAAHLDGPSFRDIWRAVMVPINRFMFNHVATECRFTSAGGAQLLADARAVAGLLGPYTQRPAAHLRETLAAARLLMLSDEEAGEVVRRVSGALAVAGGGGGGGAVAVAPATAAAAAAYKKDPLLVHLGVACLAPTQIIAVIERRV